jgi:glutamate-1-semialdehyde 2,1-aminomutase
MHYGIRPDLTSFAKILAGGMPGAAITGRKDILDLLDFKESARLGREKIGHPGTFNANPISAAAGITALTLIAETPVNETADAVCADLRAKLNAVLTAEKVPWAVYGTTSGFHLFMNPNNRAITPASFDPFAASFDELKSPPAQALHRMRLAMLVNGVDLNPRLGGFTSCTHTTADVDDTVTAFRESLKMLRAEGELPA